jgi:hypothetical protein
MKPSVLLTALSGVGLFLIFVCGATDVQFARSRTRSMHRVRLGQVFSSLIGLGAGGLLGANVARSLSGPLHPSAMINGTDVELRLVVRIAFACVMCFTRKRCMYVDSQLICVVISFLCVNRTSIGGESERADRYASARHWSPSKRRSGT